MKCGKRYDDEKILSTEGADFCDCGGYIRPDVTLYGEGLPEEDVVGAIQAISNADVLIIGGTSLSVYPAASFINYYKGNKCILINREATTRDSFADYVINDSLGKFFTEVDKRLS